MMRCIVDGIYHARINTCEVCKQNVCARHVGPHFDEHMDKVNLLHTAVKMGLSEPGAKS